MQLNQSVFGQPDDLFYLLPIILAGIVLFVIALWCVSEGIDE